MDIIQIKDKKNIGNLCFLLPISCLFFLSFLTYLNLTSDTELFGYYAYLEFFSFFRAMKPLFCCLLIVKIVFFSDYSPKQLLLIGLFLAVNYLICRSYYPNYFLLYAVTAFFAARNISYKIIAKTYLWLALVTLLLTFLDLAYGLVVDNVILRDTIVRHSFGLVHPNSFGMWSLLIIIYYIQYKQKSINPVCYILLLIQAFVVFKLTNSRTSFIASIFVICLSVFASCIKENHVIYKTALVILLAAVLLTGLLWLILSKNYDPNIPLYSKLDKMFSGRIHFSNQAMLDFPPSIFGSNITFSYPVDPLFTYTLVIYGYWGLCIFLSMIFISAIRSYKASRIFMLIAFVAFQFYNTQENVFLYHLLDITLFAATCDID